MLCDEFVREFSKVEDLKECIHSALILDDLFVLPHKEEKDNTEDKDIIDLFMEVYKSDSSYQRKFNEALELLVKDAPDCLAGPGNYSTKLLELVLKTDNSDIVWRTECEMCKTPLYSKMFEFIRYQKDENFTNKTLLRYTKIFLNLDVPLSLEREVLEYCEQKITSRNKELRNACFLSSFRKNPFAAIDHFTKYLKAAEDYEGKIEEETLLKVREVVSYCSDRIEARKDDYLKKIFENEVLLPLSKKVVQALDSSYA